jgi:undecaprenyl phosphate-alpha-L-ara4FN deformylase
VLTVHAETEGLAYRGLFERLLARHRELGIETLPLQDLAREARGRAGARAVGLGTVPGRSGRVLLALDAA